MLASSVGKVRDCNAFHIHAAVVCFVYYALGDFRDVGERLHEGLVALSLEWRHPLIFSPHSTIHCE